MDLRMLPVLGLILGAVGCTVGGASDEVDNKDVAKITKQTADANEALVTGDIDKYIALTNHAKDYVLMSPFGGQPQHGFDPSNEHRAAMAKMFTAKTFKQELVTTYNSGDLIVLVTIERVHGVIGGSPEQDWSLRVTQVFRREGSDWQLVHRHADPLANGITLEQAAALARGQK